MTRIFKESIFIVIIAFVFFGLFPLTLFKLLAFPKASAELKQEVKRNLEGVVGKQKEILTLLWEERRSHARTISDAIQSSWYIYGSDDFTPLINGEKEHEYIRLKTQLECVKADYGYKGILICDGAGIIQTATESEKSLVGANIMKEDAFRNVQETLYDGKTYMTDVIHFSLPENTQKGNEDNVPSLFMSYPIKGKNHDVTGAVLLWMDTSMLNAGMKNVALGITGETYLVNNEGVMLTKSRFSDHIKHTHNTGKTFFKVVDPETQMMTKGVKECIARKGYGYDVDGYRDYEGITVVGAWRWLENLNMGLVVELDADEAFGAINNINSLVKSLMLVVIIPAFVLAILIHKKLRTGYLLKGLTLPKKALLGVSCIIILGFVIAILDGYQLRRELGYIREQRYKINNPLNVLGSMVTQRDEDFIKDKVHKLRQEYHILKSDNTFHKEIKESERVKRNAEQPVEKTVATWELKP